VAFSCDGCFLVVYHIKSHYSWTIYRGRSKVRHCSQSNVTPFLQSENMLLKLEATNWYNWNTRNRKKLVLILINAANTIQVKFLGFIVNFKLLMFVSHNLEHLVVNFHCV
jgi:hypothetical protein